MDMKTLRPSLLLLALATSASSAPPAEPVVPNLTLAATNGRSVEIRPALGAARFTVFIFFSAQCPCMAAHDDRVKQLARSYPPGDVQFFLVDSEVGDVLERDRAEAQRRGYPFVILADPQAKLAKAFGARFATTTFVVDASGSVRYQGGIDSEKRQPSPAGRFYLKEALSALLEGKTPDVTETKSLGCYLRLV
jgi:peroxiredoxin